MSNVTISIGGRAFTVACADGEEAHVATLGRMIDERLSAMGDQSGQSESRVLLFSALLLADELHEAQSRPATPAPPPRASPQLVRALAGMAVRLENLALALEGEAANP